MIVLAFLADPDVVLKILRHLGLPISAPPLAVARASGRALGFGVPSEGGRGGAVDDPEEDETVNDRAPPNRAPS